MPTHIALLRGINVGGKGMVAMPGLATAFEGAGATDVRTYIQSGNVVFTHRERTEAKLVDALERATADYAGFDVPVVLRTTAQMRAVVEKNPYPHASGTTLHVMFYAAKVDAAALRALGLERFAPEEATAVGRDLYLHLPNGIGRAKLPPVLAKLKVPGTARNWNTVTKLLAMAEYG
jgi:uncharacterized protein (DUF1697 family)